MLDYKDDPLFTKKGFLLDIILKSTGLEVQENISKPMVLYKPITLLLKEALLL